jgi:FkbM family methyltransferase
MVESRCSGVKLRYSSQNRIGQEIFANAFERIERHLLDRILSPGLTILDIGANLGFYSCLFAQRVGAAGRVIAFEPTPSTFNALQTNVRLNGYQDLIECHCCALSNTEGIAPMNTFPDSGGVYNSFGVSRTMDGNQPQDVIDVPTTTLDKYYREEDFRNGVFIKIDVEGFEYQVIQGGTHLLKTEDRVAMMVELYEPASQQCGSSTLDTLALLESFGFEAYRMTEAADLARFDSNSKRELAAGRLPPDVFFFKPAMRPQWIN